MLAYAKGDAVMDDGDDLVRVRRILPPFPWSILRELIMLGGEYAGDTRAIPVPMATRNLTGMRWQSFEHPERAAAGTAVARAFGESGRRHNMTTAHFNVFMATEVGMVPRPDRKGVPRWCLYDPTHPNSMMPDHEAAVVFCLSASRIPRYRSDARKAILDEWENLHAGWEK